MRALSPRWARRCWPERSRAVFFRAPGDERVRSLPAGWTDVERPDPFVVLAAGKAFFCVEDLLALARLLTLGTRTRLTPP